MNVPAPAPALATTTPLTPAYARVAEVLPGLRITEDEAPRRGAGWAQAAGLAAGGAELAAFLAEDAAQIRRDYGREGRGDVVAGFALHRYGWPAAVLFTAPYFLLRRVPRLSVGDVAFHRGEGRMSVRRTTFSCLPDDPAAGHPDARVVPGEEALRAAVRQAAAEHFEPLLAAFGPHMRRGRRALWGTVTDELTESLWYVGHLLGEEGRAKAEAALLLPGGTAPYPGGAGFRELRGPEGQSLPTRDRASCCMFFTLRPEDTCVTCPRTCDADRVRRLTANS
ncbi:(2Fe-2S)-binding protein [Streptomyces hoynatensis]|uniref:(2Fe-2S)-binding protein n=1 Tax=Streptomyces hoynatensis TaxID=1141874 RepID=A0A3A9YS14_9ACTN|nr:(2Fe-2S)-binding protein [Streptomyces hoynatensis]RKN38294.1 (2Fe-2S)-binding protein [Streptomyces hoynatensis]